MFLLSLIIRAKYRPPPLPRGVFFFFQNGMVPSLGQREGLHQNEVERFNVCFFRYFAHRQTERRTLTQMQSNKGYEQALDFSPHHHGLKLSRRDCHAFSFRRINFQALRRYVSTQSPFISYSRPNTTTYHSRCL